MNSIVEDQYNTDGVDGRANWKALAEPGFGL